MALPPPSPKHTAVITGASSGIGAQLARELAGRGHGLVLVARRGDLLMSLAEDLRGSGVRVEVVTADLADPEDRAGLLDRVLELGLTPSILINNAGLSTLGPVHSADVDRELNMIAVDVVAVAELCTRFLPGMVERGQGAILNVASTAAFQPLPGQAGYGACKAFVLSYSRSLVGELAGTGVSVTALCPGPVQTGFIDAAGFSREQAESALPSFMWESVENVARCGINALAKGHPVAIPGTANLVAAMAAHLTPKRILVPLMARQHPGLKDVRRSSPGAGK